MNKAAIPLRYAEYFGASMREWREDRGLSLRELGAMLKLSAVYICDIEHGRRYPPRELDQLERWFGAIGVPLESQPVLLDAAGAARGEVAADLVDYINSQPVCRAVLRKARDMGKGEDFWRQVLADIKSEWGNEA